MKHYTGESSFYGKLPEIYDLFFLQNCDCQVAYLLNVIQNSKNLCARGGEGRTCLDIGCGTGAHAEKLAEQGIEILALDLSEDMLKWARYKHSHPNVQYIKMDITQFQPTTKFDFAVALSHVIGYQWKNSQVEDMLVHANRSLLGHGFLLFNFYHAPAVSTAKLRSKFKQVENDEYIVTRVSNAVNNPMENILEEEYYYIVETQDEIFSISIQEKMRYFSKLEIEYFLEKAGFKIEHLWRYLSKDNLTEDDWNGFIVARKIKDI